MTRQTWTAAVSALIFVIAAAVVALIPVPFVTYSPGPTVDLLAARDVPAIEVAGAKSFPTTGSLLIATTTVTPFYASVSLPEALYAHLVPDREVFPRDAIYAAGSNTTEINVRDSKLLAVSEANATAAALRSAGFAVRQVPVVQSVAQTGPAVGELYPGDIVLSVDGVNTPTVADVRAEIEKRSIGESVSFTVRRDKPDGTRETLAASVVTAASKTQANLPVWGGNLAMGYSYDPRVKFNHDRSLRGSSNGLMLALGVYDRVKSDNVTNGRVVAGTGQIDGAGNVSAVDGIREKLASAERAQAAVFFVPSANCGDLLGVTSTTRIVSVSTLDDAVAALDALADPSTEGLVKGCS